MQKVIVTGANGFVGSVIVKQLVAKGIQVAALDLEGHDHNLPHSPLVRFIPMDIADISSLPEKIPSFVGADALIHLAWVGSAGPTRTDIRLQLNNAQWTADCLRVCADLGCRRFVGAGTIMEHEVVANFSPGVKPAMPYIYGSGKLAAHAMCKPLAAQLNIDFLWAQITNTYGPGELSPRLINTTLRKFISGDTLSFTAGTQNYDFIYVDDVASAFIHIAEKGVPFSEYVIGSGGARPLKEFLLEMGKTVAPDRELIFGDMPFTGVNMPLSTFDISLLVKDTGFKPSIGFADGIRRTYDWIKEVEG
ncbi:MAG: NAD(P)-dependent oxidoreductase [Clostridium sp.]|jgi:nucleoside-diphosphate-sugar epimerase|nr:NAD(P)-dependent oxidoreductase [Clostridium sp.]